MKLGGGRELGWGFKDSNAVVSWIPSYTASQQSVTSSCKEVIQELGIPEGILWP